MTFGNINSYSLLEINGIDAPTFLQGQLTNDVNLLDKQWQFTGYCNPKGRLLALFQLWKTGSSQFSALLPEDLSESVVKRLRMYVMRSNVEISVIAKTISGFSSYQNLVTEHPAFDGMIDLASNNSVVLLGNDQTVLKVHDRFLLISDETNTTESFDSYWLEQNIVAGLPQITAESAELFIPQMVNLDILDGINFKKGCYTGQEIIARMHYLGKVKQRMFLCEISANNTNIKVGEKIYNNLEERKTVGNIVSTVAQCDKLLATLKLNHINNDLYLESGERINLIDSQPYPTPEQLQ